MSRGIEQLKDNHEKREKHEGLFFFSRPSRLSWFRAMALSPKLPDAGIPVYAAGPHSMRSAGGNGQTRRPVGRRSRTRRGHRRAGRHQPVGARVPPLPISRAVGSKSIEQQQRYRGQQQRIEHQRRGDRVRLAKGRARPDKLAQRRVVDLRATVLVVDRPGMARAPSDEEQELIFAPTFTGGDALRRRRPGVVLL